MRVYLCRHAKAAPGEPDEERELTGKGRRQAAELGTRLASLPEPPVVVLSSPLVRARQTAELIASATRAPLEIEQRLAPGATVEDLDRRRLAGAVRPEQAEYLACPHLEVDSADGLVAAVGLSQAADPDRRV